MKAINWVVFCTILHLIRAISDSEIQYVVSVGKEPFESQRLVHSEELELTTRSGSRVRCWIPSGSESDEEVNLESGDNLSEGTPSLSKSKESLRGYCALHQMGYWTFEVCPFTKVRQFRVDGPSFDLGRYSFEKSHLSEGNIQSFVEGSDGRSAEVRIACSKSVEDALVIRSVVEPRPLFYEIFMESPLICDARVTGENRKLDPIEDAIFRVVKSMQRGCLLLFQGWWNYRFCFGDKLTQFHQEQVPVNREVSNRESTEKSFEVLITNEFNLGSWPLPIAINLNTLDSMDIPSEHIFLHNATNHEESYLGIIYRNGDPCDLTGESRQTEIRFRCNEDTQISRIASIAEVATCQYMLIVETDSLCSHPAFSLKSPNTHIIKCSSLS